MRNKSFIAIALILIVAIASCGEKKKTLEESLVGIWAGIDTIQIASIDTTGAVTIETIAVPIAIEYFADTTMAGKIVYNDTTQANMADVVIVGDPYITYSGMMNVNDQAQDLNGELFYQENPEQLTMEFFSKNPVTGQEHKGKAVLTKQAAPPVK